MLINTSWLCSYGYKPRCTSWWTCIHLFEFFQNWRCRHEFPRLKFSTLWVFRSVYFSNKVYYFCGFSNAFSVKFSLIYHTDQVFIAYFLEKNKSGKKKEPWPQVIKQNFIIWTFTLRIINIVLPHYIFWALPYRWFYYFSSTSKN
jgi:hypothetical protein